MLELLLYFLWYGNYSRSTCKTVTSGHLVYEKVIKHKHINRFNNQEKDEILFLEFLIVVPYYCFYYCLLSREGKVERP